MNRDMIFFRAYLSFECFQETIFFGSKGNFHVASRLLSGTLLLFMLSLIFPDLLFCLQTNKSKQSNIGIESRFETQNICFAPE